MDVQTFCRGCMKEVASWERRHFDPRVVEMFSFCTNLRITDEDKLPQQFCYDCIIKIKSSYTFITEAQKVHVTLKNIISRTNTSIIIEPETYTKHPEIKLTLPDYKICSVIEDSRIYEPVKKTTESYNVESNVEENEVVNDPESVENKPEGIENEPENLGVEPDNVVVEPENGVVEPESLLNKPKNVVVEPEVVKDKNVCPVCRKSFTSKTWFSKHMQKEHTRKYVCEHCPKAFSRPSQLTSHAISHSEERKFACSACGKRFKRRKQLSVHTRAHGDARPFACDQCPARFKTKSILKSHMSVHKKDKAFLCYYCGWSFAQAGNLKVHIRCHTGEKPYTCTYCSYSARAASALRRHERGHGHAGSRRPHACSRCGKRFHDTSNLARHIRTHTGALPYKCPSCPSAFSDSWKRKAHLMRTHKIPLQDIPIMKTDGRVVQLIQ